MKHYDLFVIGAGPGGYNAAIRASILGMKVALAEKSLAGGTCLNRGCIPTKALLHASAAYHQAQNWEAIGLKADNISFDIEAVYEQMDKIVSTQRQGLIGLFQQHGIDFYEGTAKVRGKGQVEINDETIESEHILIATGSAPAKAPIPGADSTGVVTSDDLLKLPGTLPASLVIIGGGVIGCELASFYRDLGTEVTVIEALDRLLPLMDESLGAHLQTLFKRHKITVRTAAKVEEIRAAADGLEVVYSVKDKAKTVSAENVLLATGRRPVTDDLFAEDFTPTFAGRFIKVDENYRTSLPGVYAVGDVIGGLQLAHKAEAEGQHVAYHLAGRTCVTDPLTIPSAIYTEPEIASVGYSEAELKEAGIAYKVGMCQTLSNARSQIEQVDRGFVKLLVEEDSRRLLGVHLIISRASDLIAIFTPYISHGSDYRELMRGVYPHPSFSEVIREALEDVEDGAIHMPPKKA